MFCSWPNWMEKEDLLEMGKSIVLPYKLSLGRGSNVICYKSVHHPFPTRGNREHPGKFQNESVSSPFSWLSWYIIFLPKLKGRGRPFLRCAKRASALWDCPQEYLVAIRDENVSPFVKFEIFLHLLCFLLDPLTEKAMQGMEFYDKSMDRFQGISKVKNPATSRGKL